MVLDDMGLEASIEHLMFGSPAENAAKYSRGTPNQHTKRTPFLWNRVRGQLTLTVDTI
jgi:hypothetical protein